MTVRTHIAGAILLSGALFLAGGCGYKTKPVPPDSIVPKAIEDLRYSVSEKGVTLTWTYPVETIQGSDLTNITSFDMYRAVVPMDDYCSTCPIPFGEPVEVPGGVVDAEGRRQATYETALLRSGHKYFFKVQSRTSWWAASADSNIVSFVWHIPAQAPVGIEAEAGDGSVTLRWQPVTRLMDGQEVDYPLRYQLQRSSDNVSFAGIGEAVSENVYVDRRVKNGETYHYKIQSVIMVDENAVGGGLSEAVSAMPLDMTPPASPGGVTVVRTAAGIKVFWDKSPEADVHGYRVYRRAADESEAQLIGEVQAVYTIFEDADVPQDRSFYYSVTAYDQMTPPNESEKSREAGIRH
ncbi:MAG: hypothetical protein KKD01_17550 [Proteobacteria bacterium]|nr:hypothetical protein [Pseudomonadota bacterium]MBU1419024.1 hypothetical protein [Pseudomonadota bacterium]MBU1456530.1 hypothetical protein [Pseudomonadota bacterium]